MTRKWQEFESPQSTMSADFVSPLPSRLWVYI
jgi:hypothetical protein